MNNSRGKYIVGILTVAIMIAFTGCRKEKDPMADLDPTQWMNEVDKQSDKLYDGVTALNNDSTYNTLYNKRCEEYPEYALEIGSSLVYQMERYKEEPEKTFHVIFYTMPETPLTQEFVDGINEKYNLDLNIDEWEGMNGNWIEDIMYYHTLTAKEIIALADCHIVCRYIGSGEGKKTDVNFDTLEGIYVFNELYGDQYVQYKEDMNRQY